MYDFAVEFSDKESFIAAYSDSNANYSFVDKKGNQANGKPAILCVKTQPQSNNDKNLCMNCKDVDLALYEGCDSRPFVSIEYTLNLALNDKTFNNQIYCESCQQYVYAYRSKCVKLRIQDVRMCGRAVKLLINRKRFLCPNCNSPTGKTHLYGLQAYCGGQMTPRLAENVLYAQLSSVKREYIAEAYGLSRSQIDRIKKRMIESVKTNKMSTIKSNVATHQFDKVILKVFKGKNTGHIYYTYFLKSKSEGVFLINILTNAERDAITMLQKTPKILYKHFPDENSFYFACFCILAGEKNKHGKELIERLNQLNVMYTEKQNRQTDPMSDELVYNKAMETEDYRQEETKNSSLSKTKRSSLSKKTQNFLLNLLQGSTNIIYDLTPHAFPQIDGPQEDIIKTEKSGQLNFLSALTIPFSLDDSELPDFAIVESFAYYLKEAVQRIKISAKELINSLLYFNPSTVRVTDTGTPHIDLKRQIDILCQLDETNDSGDSLNCVSPIGVPISCLIYQLQQGLLSEDNTALIPCLVINTSEASETVNCQCPYEKDRKDCPRLSYCNCSNK